MLYKWWQHLVHKKHPLELEDLKGSLSDEGKATLPRTGLSWTFLLWSPFFIACAFRIGLVWRAWWPHTYSFYRKQFLTWVFHWRKSIRTQLNCSSDGKGMKKINVCFVVALRSLSQWWGSCCKDTLQNQKTIPTFPVYIKGRQGRGLFDLSPVCQCDGEWPRHWQAFQRQHSKGGFSTQIWKDNEGILLLFTKILPNSSKEKSPEVVSIKMLTSER